MVRSLTLGLVAVVSAGVSAGILVSTACITAPPPELPQEVEHAPAIQHDSVQPPSNRILPQLPTGGFIVPILLQDPNESFQYDVFVDYDSCADLSTCQPTLPLPPGVQTVKPTPGTADGGVVMVAFDPSKDVDPTQCHSIEFVVAHQFQQGLPHTPDTTGGDSVTWIYDPGGATPCTLLVYDAGKFQDGAFPPADAPAEALPAVPESGTD